MKDIELWHGDCLELMKNIPDRSVDLVLVDPPYGTVKSLGSSKDGYISNFKGNEWDVPIPTKEMFIEISRVLKSKRKAIIFSQEPYTSSLISSAIDSLPFDYRAIWYKNSSGHNLNAKHSMVNVFEDICIFSKRTDTYDHPLKEVFNNELKKSGKSRKDAVNLVGHTANHYFTNGVQFYIPSKKNFKVLKDNGFITLDYDECVEIDKKYFENNKGVFNLWEGNNIKSNVLQYKKESERYHPTQKPILLLEDLIKTFSNENDLVLDFTMGSGSTGVACCNLNRKFIGIEKDDKFFEIAQNRVLSR